MSNVFIAEAEKLRGGNRRSAAAVATGFAAGALPYPQTPSLTLDSTEAVQQCAQETLEELDWCLDQLETIQVHRSVTEMASSKFKKLLGKELSHFAESSKAGTQISRYIMNTYTEDRSEEDEEKKDKVSELVNPEVS